MRPPLAIISHLASRIDDIRHSQARACVLWLVGQYCEVEAKGSEGGGPEGIADWAPDVLRKAAKTFSSEVKPYPLIYLAKSLTTCDSDYRSETTNLHPGRQTPRSVADITTHPSP